MIEMKEENQSKVNIIIGFIIIIILVVMLFYYIPNKMTETITDEYETNLFTKNGTILSVERVRSGFGIWMYNACEVYFVDGEMIAFRENATCTYALLKPYKNNNVNITYGQIDAFGTWNKLKLLNHR